MAAVYLPLHLLISSRLNVVHHISEEFMGEDFGIAYMYHNFGDKGTQDTAQIFASILRQLGGQKGKISPEIESLYKRLSPTFSKPNIPELVNALVAVMQEFSRVWLFFGALDECLEENLRAVLSNLKKHFKIPEVQIFATSRPYLSDVKNAFADQTILEVSTSTKDIETFVQNQMSHFPFEDPDESPKSEIIDKVIEESRSM